jgi:N-acetylmuramoyl-L-alanine amidase
VTKPRTQILKAATTLTLGAITCLSAPAQTAPPLPPTPPRPTPTRSLILLDPAHGGSDTGAHLTNNALEKDVTLAFTARIKPLLAAAGFTVLSTHDADAELTTDQRAGIANHARATACLILHATASGSGLHIATSALPEDSTPPRNPIPWDTAQTSSLPQSLRLANELGLALDHAKLPVLLTRASIRPLENLTCPAIAIELAPLTTPGSDPTPVTNATYQQHAAEAIVTALTTFRAHTIPQAGAPR